MDIEGVLILINPATSGTSKAGKNWSKQEFVIETQDQFPVKICFTLFGDKMSLLNNLSVGDLLDVYFNLESREVNGKWYHSINAWKVEVIGSSDSQSDKPYGSHSSENEPDADDLPF